MPGAGDDSSTTDATATDWLAKDAIRSARVALAMALLDASGLAPRWLHAWNGGLRRGFTSVAAAEDTARSFDQLRRLYEQLRDQLLKDEAE